MNQERVARRLLRSSADRSYDPQVDVDWCAPHEEDKLYFPTHRLPLYGTSLWESLSRGQRIELARQEAVTLSSVVIHAELSLMRSLLRAVQEGAPASDPALYALAEVADECRHSTMFARAITWLGGSVVPQSRLVTKLVNIVSAVIPQGPFFWASALFFEEPVDRLQREAMSDESIQPLLRMVYRIHVLEESRHVTYAREAALRTMAEAGPLSRRLNRIGVALLAWSLGRTLLRPATYRRAGLSSRAAYRAALANPHYHESLRWMSERLVAFCADAGFIEGWLTSAIWRRSHLL
ncbi:diiron oxygenase [Amycolatopsis sp. DG1A-15b]|uniref:AurF N-oxygenase family protein n=1 Tax=Amycolatopsis sp. DG1A-15b TaxID=3052846 RepID=UPI00255BC679|nr:diiron oxygenase [Amycolatopsis sp. DG1A-15b]WIX92964.1 diiron oxygenase [Amycolatopsis sp. DG1A-15b]